MKKYFVFLIGLLLTLTSVAQVPVPSKPNPPRLVNDYTNTLTPEQVEALERKLVAYDDSTSNQVAVVIIPDTKDYPIEDISLQILRQWGVGGAEHSNGVVLLVAKNDRKVRIETGYGLEGAIPDITARAIIDNDLLPNFRENNYYAGIDHATDDIFRAAAGEYKAPAGYNKKGKGGGIGIAKIIFNIGQSRWWKRRWNDVPAWFWRCSYRMDHWKHVEWWKRRRIWRRRWWRFWWRRIWRLRRWWRWRRRRQWQLVKYNFIYIF
jgi:uncharacterized protein